MSEIRFQTLEEPRMRLLGHPVYRELNSVRRLRIFMQHHVFAVWDFMSLLKRLQRDLTCVEVPWIPKMARHARFVNEIVLAEETDEDGRGGYASHFELYVEAMRECGADTGPIESFQRALWSGASVFEALDGVPGASAEFVRHSLDVAMHGTPHEVAAAFFFGREDIIPEMFGHIVNDLSRPEEGESEVFEGTAGLMYYLRRHIELDGDTHGPLAGRLLDDLCAGDPRRIAEAEAAAQAALGARIALWDGVAAEFSRLAG